MTPRWPGGEAGEGDPALFGAPGDPVVDALHRYLDSTAVPPPHDLSERIDARLSAQPVSTAPRRLLAALVALDGRGVLRGLRQCLTLAFGPGARPLALRLQAVASVLVAVVTVSLGSAVGVAGARVVVSGLTEGPRSTAPDDRPRPIDSAPLPALGAAPVVRFPQTSPSPHPMPPTLTVADADDAARADAPGPPVAPRERSQGAGRAGGRAADRRPPWAGGGHGATLPGVERGAGRSGDKAPATPPGRATGADLVKELPLRRGVKPDERERD